jgi:hypothetical protein
MWHLAGRGVRGEHILVIHASDAMLLALRELADPACRRCRGRGHRGDDLVAGLCRCVSKQFPAEAPACSAADDDMPHPWPLITRRAQTIHAAAMMQFLPDDWS